ncbi:hypothetical protein K402DRAFT_165440 [Aulographum hederae CBS 113979]|uniref:Uncharacterized protein n=1 Tax=Aulographum hederae CBS 113979 TaxID=1176131 RepID=A0A6G1GQX1_9PEZI|nr:hypothetical protein K402DRAFT_165440 [Aulographum hederae CBS 113979]
MWVGGRWLESDGLEETGLCLAFSLQSGSLRLFLPPSPPNFNFTFLARPGNRLTQRSDFSTSGCSGTLPRRMARVFFIMSTLQIVPSVQTKVWLRHILSWRRGGQPSNLHRHTGGKLFRSSTNTCNTRPHNASTTEASSTVRIVTPPPLSLAAEARAI